ncbi:MAG: class I SAM-dependent methyltransferase, partial [Planctomycetota bacterium]|nr:class I SAM-dependent methyltransferase [Planctomycetota bacterium]
MPFDHLHPTVKNYVASEALAVTYEAYFRDMPLFRYDCNFIAEYARPPGPALDLGCGTGRHLAFLEARGIAAYGIDLNPHMLREGRRHRPASQRLRLIQADFHFLPLRPGTKFQCILLMFSTLGLVWPCLLYTS